MSVILVMSQFQTRFPQIADGASRQGFHKGLVTALLELGALAVFGMSWGPVPWAMPSELFQLLAAGERCGVVGHVELVSLGDRVLLPFIC